MYKNQGKLEGEHKGKAETLINLIKAKFGQIDPSIENKIKNSSLAQLDSYLLKLLTATSTDDVFNKS